MTVSARTVGSIVVLDLEGKLTVEANLGEIQKEVKELVRQKKGNIILNLAGIHALECAGIGLLVTSCCSVRDIGGELKLLNVSEGARRMLAMAGLLAVFEAYDSEQEAVASFLGTEKLRTYLERRFLRIRAVGSRAT